MTIEMVFFLSKYHRLLQRDSGGEHEQYKKTEDRCMLSAFDITMRMVRQKTQIRKIENLAARQVTFSKRRRGLFKKAQEFMNQVLERHRLQSQNVGELRQPSREMQTESRKSAMLSKELAEKSIELRQMKGEDLQGLDLQGLDKLEAVIESGLVEVVKTKGERMLKEISTLKKKEAQLLEENAFLKRQLAMMDTSIGQMGIHDQCCDHHSLELTISSLSSRDPPHNYNISSSDTCLKLGQPFSN
ncbi:Transcription factor, K-box [Cynara cardunculus var. scolymus]|uniref:Transcription factor, K-box n=1 Tax=Cynara cardunculus var. scolymus TaxID=59895 RepID=A0A118K3T5_CYNCS|nr:Transcription factor, K-box [Cynara cardunculus var. scolymus]